MTDPIPSWARPRVSTPTRDLALPTLRPRDETGRAYGWLRAANGRVEDLAEIYHRFYLTDHLSLSLVAQYALHLAGDEEIEPLEGVFLGGFRTQVNF